MLRPNVVHPQGLFQVRAALDAAELARTRRQKRTALAAITAAQEELARHAEKHGLDRELVALVGGRNWSNDRVLSVERQLTEAKDRLSRELA